MTGTDPYADVWTLVDRGRTPATVRIALILMVLGALAALVGVIITLTNIHHIRSLFEATVPKLEPDKVDSATMVSVIQQVVFNVIRAAVWIGLAYFVRQGRGWARVVATIIAVIGIALTLRGVGGTDDVAPMVVGWVQIVCGALAVILIWLPPSMTWFRPRQVVGFDS
jgi:hypothetical protein